MGDQELPPFVELCHWTAGVGLPDAAAVTVTVWPEVMDWLEGWDVTPGRSGSSPSRRPPTCR